MNASKNFVFLDYLMPIEEAIGMIAKHIDIRYHFVRRALHSDHISIDYIPSPENSADILTKTLESFKHHYCIELMKLD